MCMYTDNKKKPIIAKGAILVYKTLTRLTEESGYPEYQGSDQYSVHTIPPTVSINYNDYGTGFQVHKGYHSRSRSRGTDNSSNQKNNALFVIPAGSEIMSGYENDKARLKNYVSTDIIFVGRNTFINRWRTRKILHTFVKKK